MGTGGVSRQGQLPGMGGARRGIALHTVGKVPAGARVYGDPAEAISAAGKTLNVAMGGFARLARESTNPDEQRLGKMVHDAYQKRQIQAFAADVRGSGGTKTVAGFSVPRKIARLNAADKARFLNMMQRAGNTGPLHRVTNDTYVFERPED